MAPSSFLKTFRRTTHSLPLFHRRAPTSLSSLSSSGSPTQIPGPLHFNSRSSARRFRSQAPYTNPLHPSSRVPDPHPFYTRTYQILQFLLRRLLPLLLLMLLTITATVLYVFSAYLDAAVPLRFVVGVSAALVTIAGVGLGLAALRYGVRLRLVALPPGADGRSMARRGRSLHFDGDDGVLGSSYKSRRVVQAAASRRVLNLDGSADEDRSRLPGGGIRLTVANPTLDANGAPKLGSLSEEGEGGPSGDQSAVPAPVKIGAMVYELGAEGIASVRRVCVPMTPIDEQGHEASRPPLMELREAQLKDARERAADLASSGMTGARTMSPPNARPYEPAFPAWAGLRPQQVSRLPLQPNRTLSKTSTVGTARPTKGSPPQTLRPGCHAVHKPPLMSTGLSGDNAGSQSNLTPTMSSSAALKGHEQPLGQPFSADDIGAPGSSRLGGPSTLPDFRTYRFQESTMHLGKGIQAAIEPLQIRPRTES